jgi:phosphoribosylcarboxyaminoimidazole (NCAIR) mutase
MLALSDDTLAEKLEAMKREMAEAVSKKDADIQKVVAEL